MLQRRLTHFFSVKNDSKYSPPLPTISVASLARQNDSSISRKRKRSSLRSDGDPYQMTLDAGQRRIGSQYCSKCGMVYSIDVTQDVDAHEKYHQMHVDTEWIRLDKKTMKFWGKSAASVCAFPEGEIFKITAKARRSIAGRIETLVNCYVNEELGFSANLPVWTEERQCFVYVQNINGPKICCLVLVDPISTARTSKSLEEQTGCFMGINRVWVHRLFRHRGIATRLLDTARKHFLVGCSLERSECAFSDPTVDGVKLAVSYIGHCDFLVYTF